MKHYMLDTNTVSYLFKKNPNVVQQVTSKPVSSICISAITEGELLFGLAKRPEAKQLHKVVREFLQRIDVLAWDSAIAERYGIIRAKMERQGKILSSLDLLIATHALESKVVLVTSDKAFSHVPGLHIENWVID